MPICSLMRQESTLHYVVRNVWMSRLHHIWAFYLHVSDKWRLPWKFFKTLIIALMITLQQYREGGNEKRRSWAPGGRGGVKRLQSYRFEVLQPNCYRPVDAKHRKISFQDDSVQCQGSNTQHSIYLWDNDRPRKSLVRLAVVVIAHDKFPGPNFYFLLRQTKILYSVNQALY